MATDRYADRREAGRALAALIRDKAYARPIVLALPRGGVPVAYEVAEALGAPLDLLLVRKIGAPGQEELAIGAMVEGHPPRVLLSPELVRASGASPAYIEGVEVRERAELERRRRAYLGDRPPPEVAGRTVIVVDDGIATGATMRAALAGLAGRGVLRLVLAVPVAPPDTLAELAPLVDEVVCPRRPEDFFAVGAHYVDFDQTSDEEVVALLSRRPTGE